MRVRADDRIREREPLPAALRRHDDAAKMLQIDLMADAGIRRDDLEIVEIRLRPFQQFVAFGVALVFLRNVFPQRVRRAEIINLHGMIHNQFDRHERVDVRRIAAKLPHRVAHRGQIHDRRNAGEILHQHSRRMIRNFDRRGGFRLPTGDIQHVFRLHDAPVKMAQQIFHENFD